MPDIENLLRDELKRAAERLRPELLGVVAVLFSGRAPAEAVKSLMERDPKAEV